MSASPLDLAVIRTALEAGLSLVDHLEQRPLAPVTSRRLLPLKQAAHELHVSVKTARRRARAGGGFFQNGKWHLDVNSPAVRGERS